VRRPAAMGRPATVAKQSSAGESAIGTQRSLIGHDLPVGESITSPDSGHSALASAPGLFNAMGQRAIRRRPQ
jgi:hypothetical protein